MRLRIRKQSVLTYRWVATIWQKHELLYPIIVVTFRWYIGQFEGYQYASS
jgi:hypothetical protein